MKKILTVIGARPQFIKAAVLSRIIVEKSEFKEVIVHTGQHFDQNMSEVFFEEMELPSPKYNLEIHELTHGAMTGRMMESIEKVMLKENPDFVLVYGDTNSTLAGALCASKLHIPVGHVEAGLRSNNMNMPEEINRILTDRISNLLFCPTDKAVHNLSLEGFENFDAEVVKSGDIMKDAVEYYSDKANLNSSILNRYQLKRGEFVLATIHRQENTDDPDKLKNIFEGLDSISAETTVIMPIHPRTKKRMATYKLPCKFLLVDPVGYFDMLVLLSNCKMVVTDSGGLQKESFFNQKPCIIVREETEWIELVEKGFAKIVGSDPQRMIEAFHQFQKQQFDFDVDLYGNDVGLKIYNEIKRYLAV